MSTRRTRSSTAKAAIKHEEPQQLSSPPATPAPTKRRNTTKATAASEPSRTPKDLSPVRPNMARKRSKTAIKSEEPKEEEEEMPHNLGPMTAHEVDLEPPKASTPKSKKRKAPTKTQDDTDVKPKKPRTSRTKPKFEPTEDVKAMADKLYSAAEEPASTMTTPDKKSKKTKKDSYGLTPGQTPFPDWPHPTAEECHEVARILSKVHGTVKAPKTIPIPSLTTAGCGEVPSVLDALIRTRLSANTSNTNSSRAFRGLVDKFGTIKEGIGKGSVDWDKVRLADQKEVFEAIKSGGLADVKSKDIKKILQLVYEENQERVKTVTSGNSNEKEAVEGEAEKLDNNILSLDHLHGLSSEDAFNHLIKYPGIGPKTASCVVLFCLQRPSFAVDTHVFRLCRWLGWVPPTANRNTTFAHCEVKVPDELKYPLHVLLIKHGKQCPRCRAITGEGSRGWEEGCPLEELVKRTGGRKGVGGGSVGGTPKGKGKGKGGKKSKLEHEDEESEELSDLGSESPGDEGLSEEDEE